MNGLLNNLCTLNALHFGLIRSLLFTNWIFAFLPQNVTKRATLFVRLRCQLEGRDWRASAPVYSVHKCCHLLINHRQPLRVQAEALGKSAGPLANAAFISFAFFIWILISCTVDSKGHSDKEFLHATSPSQLRCSWLSQNSCSGR